MSDREKEALRELGTEFNAATAEERNLMLVMLTAFKAGIAIGEKRAAS